MKRAVVGLAALWGCTATGTAGTASGAGPRPTTGSFDSTAMRLIPAGYGTMHLADIALRLQPSSVIVNMLPLDENVIRLLTSDSYQTMRSVQESNRANIASIARKYGVQRTSLWYVTFYGVAQESRISPMDLLITSLGRDHRPLEVIPLTTGFSEHLLKQREKQSALYIFDGDIDVNQPLTVAYLTEKNETWQDILPRLESERVRVRARAGGSQ